MSGAARARRRGSPTSGGEPEQQPDVAEREAADLVQVDHVEGQHQPGAEELEAPPPRAAACPRGAGRARRRRGRGRVGEGLVRREVRRSSSEECPRRRHARSGYVERRERGSARVRVGANGRLPGAERRGRSVRGADRRAPCRPAGSASSAQTSLPPGTISSPQAVVSASTRCRPDRARRSARAAAAPGCRAGVEHVDRAGWSRFSDTRSRHAESRVRHRVGRELARDQQRVVEQRLEPPLGDRSPRRTSAPRWRCSAMRQVERPPRLPRRPTDSRRSTR